MKNFWEMLAISMASIVLVPITWTKGKVFVPDKALTSSATTPMEGIGKAYSCVMSKSTD